ncbi:MAG: shikimate kinase [Nitrospirota bacterium]|nr:shikimate kinase [Nitrospirota bacterium]
MKSSPPRSNIILIGMPGSGKSTVGVLLAKQTGRAFTDTDLLIQSDTGRTLQNIVDRDGYLELRRIEERVLRSLLLRNHVVATGGSAVYSSEAMDHLKADGVVVFLDADPATLEARVADFGTRGLAKRPDQTFQQLFDERLPLYRKYAEITITCAGLSHEQVVGEIMDAVENLC